MGYEDVQLVKKAATGAKRSERHSLAVLAVSLRAGTMQLDWKGPKGMKDRGHFLETELETGRQLPVVAIGAWCQSLVHRWSRVVIFLPRISPGSLKKSNKRTFT